MEAKRIDCGKGSGVGVRMEGLEARRMLSGVGLDATFGNGGRSVLSFEGGYRVAAVHPTTEGKIVVVVARSDGGISLVRVNSDGSIDKGFGSNGVVLANISASDTKKNNFSIATDARSGRIAVMDGEAVTMFDFKGNLDRGWGGTGSVPLHAGAIGGFQPDGRLLVVVPESVAMEKGVLVELLKSNGTMDDSFGNFGSVLLSERDSRRSVSKVSSIDSVIVDAHGLIFVAAKLYYQSSAYDSGLDSLIWRLGADGSGKKVIGSSEVASMAADGQGGLVYVSPDGFFQSNPVLLYRVKADGTAAFKPIAILKGNSVAVQPDGKILLTTTGFTRLAIQRLTADGLVDKSYNFYAYDPHFNDVWGLQNDGKALVAGIDFSDGTSKIIIERLERGPIDPGTIERSVKGVVTLTGTERGESISVSIRARDGRVVARVGDSSRSFARSAIKSIVVSAKQGNDSISIGMVVGAMVDGGDGDDTIIGGDANDVLIGGWGNDRLEGGAGNDKLGGGVGNDYLLGGAGKDLLAGNGGADVLKGSGGNDRLFGGAGVDRVSGGAGKDVSEKDLIDRLEEDVEGVV